MTLRMKTPRGLTLVEATIALTILAVGLIGLMRLHVLGITSNTGGRMHTQAVEIARELVAGIERLGYTDPRLSDTATPASTPPAAFGWLVEGAGVVSTDSGIHVWSDASDSSQLPGVRPASALPPGFERRWTVWGYVSPSGGITSVRIVAVSVTWREPSFPRLREVVLYTQMPNPAALMASLATNG
jgi:hypothetical protein